MEEYSIECVTSKDDIEAVAIVFMKAAQHGDKFVEMMSRYGPEPPYEGLLKALQESIGLPNYHVFKAVHNSTGQVVGMAVWKAPTYLEIEKVDPFASAQPGPVRDATIDPLSPALQEAEDPVEAAGFAMWNDSRRQIWNAYITHIRGKKHVFLSRLAVLPEHQKRGIASRLMQWGANFADANGIVAFLNGRPAALRLYKNFGFKTVNETYFKFDDLEVAPVTTMLRMPLPGKRIEQ